MTRAAAIDVGTNSILLTIAERTPQGLTKPLEEWAQVTRLGAGVDQSGMLQSESIRRSLEVLQAYAQSMDRHHVQSRAAVGTSALRSARNGTQFLSAAQQILGVPVEVISGDREAALCIAGVEGALGPLSEGSLVFDVGGGSTEFIARPHQHANSSAKPVAVSLEMGTVRLLERHLHHDPPTPLELACALADIQSTLDLLPTGLSNASNLVGVAGTVTTLVTIQLALDNYDAQRVNGFVLQRAEVQRQLGLLCAMPLEQRRKVPGLEPDRADVMVAGAMLVDAIMARFAANSLRVSDRGVRWGLISELLSRGAC